MAKEIGIDLGTSNTCICAKGRGIVLREPSIIAINKLNKHIVALGRDAKKMVGKTPTHINVCRPLENGVISDMGYTTAMLGEYLAGAELVTSFSKPAVLVSIPYGVTEVERRAVKDAVSEAGAKSVRLIEEPIAAAIGAGLRVAGPKGSMIIDMGGGTSEVAIISLGGIVKSSSLRIAGDKFDDSIIQYLKKERNILVGEMTAEALKIKIGSAHESTDGGEMKICGRSLKTGLAMVTTVKSGEIREAMSEDMELIITSIKQTLEDAPAELSSDIYDYGIMLTGGCALIEGMDLLIRQRIGVRVTVAKNPLDSVCVGLARVLDGGYDKKYGF